MKQRYVSDVLALEAGAYIIESFYLSDIKTGVGRGGAMWYDAVLEDKTGVLVGRLWRDSWADGFDSILELVGSVVEVEAFVDKYESRAQLKVLGVRAAESDSLSEYTAELNEDVRRYALSLINSGIASIADEKLRYVVSCVLTESRLNALMRIPGAHKHHAFNGGACIEVCEVLELFYSYSKIFEQFKDAKGYGSLDVDSCISAILVSQLGKLSLYNSLPDRRRKDRGMLTGYLSESISLFNMANSGLPKEKRASTAQIVHILRVLDDSAEPMTKEALLVKNLFSTVVGVDRFDAALDSECSEGFFYCKTMGRTVYRKERSES